ncbi:TPR-like protein [Basidiobolus meristosporus CBS 931.73]|uniref:TPR-like protein n=1 Tax=Basidiobolus meristosporus CBS 931.73 TaxID=1314790 RepID=A0A1Y1YAR2_9FUNG|nr:TPR-like protein [Basidiobolus meristosporus CBS 931.73]|eukprot:ORX94704.1 TPR-like protein [Basidiobolus meristosporus CBS 931.73]
MSAFQDLVGGGADCSSGNPMSGLMKRFGQDRSLQQDRFGPDMSASSSRGAFRGPAGPGVIERNFTEEFLSEGGVMVEDMYNFDQLGHELDHIQGMPGGPVPGDWAADFMKQPELQAGGVDPHFAEFEEVFRQHQNPNIQAGWEDEFARYEQENTALLPNETEEFDRAFEQAKQGASWEQEFERQDNSWAGEFETQHANELQGDNSLSNEFVYSEGRKEFNSVWDDSDEEVDEIKHLDEDQEWSKLQGEWDKQSLGANHPMYNEYHFQENNPFLANPSLIKEDTLAADLNESILMLEAKVQLDPQDGLAWNRLGIRQQENEREPEAIAALRRAINIDPTILEAWIALAVSYTNENLRSDAYDSLQSWISNHPQYHDIINGQNSMDRDRHTAVTNLFLEAARQRSQDVDPDVQVGLGVLLNISEEYSKAVDCFQAALASKPNDYLLWNKLGATLANSNDPGRAIDAYFNALEINPSYIRARYNLAVSCINLGQHHEAAEHLLQALALQSGDGNGKGKLPPSGDSGMSSNVWDTLRMTLYMINRPDLASRCDSRDLQSFRGEFDF